MTAYLAGIPEPLYALFGTGYLGYTVARELGKGEGRRTLSLAPRSRRCALHATHDRAPRSPYRAP